MTAAQAPAGVLAEGILRCTGFGHDIRWRSGERLEQLFERHCDRMRDDGHGDRLAVDSGDVRLTFTELDEHANRLARHLLAHGAAAGDRIGLLFDQPAFSYIAMLAVLKINAAYVPLDAAFPDDRLAYIAEDAGIRRVLSLSSLSERVRQLPVDLIRVDDEQARISGRPGGRLTVAEKGDPAGELCYVVYTSGSTGRPKGVAIDHAAICNFVRVAVEVYGITPEDRVYQGMTIAFDFSVEEIWVPLLAGATLVPKPGGAGLLGAELEGFLRDNRVTALCCVPTLLATLDEDLPDLRFLLVSGEACPEDLIARWHKPGRRFLNVYGPTETTVTATWSVVSPERPVTIGVPLPTYSAVILDPERPAVLARGELGEIGIAGIGLAGGYLNRPDLTERAFIPDFLGIESNPSGRIYRTGDLGRITAEGEIEYHGRTDTQVKIRGYRIELTEIESVLLQVPGIAQAVVDTYEREPGTVELVAYFTLRRDTDDVDADDIRQRLRERLPGYMVPAYLEQLDRIPMTPADKADRRNLPAPTSARGASAGGAHVAPANAVERGLAEVLAQVLGLARVSADSHFFDDLGANSLLLARMCARVRDRGDLPPLSMKEVYQNSTVQRLATAVTRTAASAPRPEAAQESEPPYRASTTQYVLCGAVQLLVFLGYALGAGVLLDKGFTWIYAAAAITDGYLRAVGLGVVGFAALCVVPIAAKWLLVGRWKPVRIPVWSLSYLRFWTVKTLIRFSPLMLFAGSPLYVLYLRALGAKIGKGAVILSRNPPVCTDLLKVGAGAVIRKDTHFAGYRVVAGRIQTGAVTLGAHAFVGEMSVLDIDTTIGDNAQLGHASSLHAGQAVPAGESWHGSPAQRSTVDYRALDTVATSPLRRVVFCVSQLLVLVLVTLPLLLVGMDLVTLFVYPAAPDFTSWTFYRDQVAGSFALYVGGLSAGLLLVLAVPRLLGSLLRPDRVYPLYGFRYSVQRSIARISNLRVFTYLFGDSSYIVHYLRALGYDLSEVEQTGSNFGVEVKHETPALSTVGSGTMVSDGLSLLNADFSASSFRLRRAWVAPRSFLGNNIAYPPGARIGQDCLLATKVLVPLDGPVRENVGLLGSPAFEIPRSVRRDSDFDHLKTEVALRRSLGAKNRHNTATMLVYLLVQWLHLLGIVLIGVATAAVNNRYGSLSTAAEIVLTLLFSVSFLVLMERAVQGFRSLRPRFCSIYDPVFWRHERFWKLSAGRYLAVFNGTPFKNLLWRLLGVRIGHRVFDDGCAIPEKSLITLGDDCSLNAGSTIQCHSLEDGTFKADHITIGPGSTIGVGAFVHYGVEMGAGTVLDADAFLMKGSEPPPRSRWRGNPAIELTTDSTTSRRIP